MILVYPVINMFYGGSRLSLLGEHPDESLAAQVCPDRHVSDLTPPAFLVHAADDVAVPCQDSLNMALALRSQGVSVELHLYEHGGHGFGASPMAPRDPALATWLEHLETWLKSKGY